MLDYCDISMAEGPWPDKAYHDAARRERLRGAPQSIDYVLRRPPVVSNGPVPPPSCVLPPQVDPRSIEPAGAEMKDTTTPVQPSAGQGPAAPLPVSQAEQPAAGYIASWVPPPGPGALLPAGRCEGLAQEYLSSASTDGTDRESTPATMGLVPVNFLEGMGESDPPAMVFGAIAPMLDNAGSNP